MRALKFRVWDSEKNIMFSHDWLYSACVQYGALVNNPRKAITTMQYTGLQDKNGKEIYEGDVVDLFWPFVGATYKCKVFWFVERGCWAMAQDEGKATYNGIFHYFGSQDTKLMDIEVMGNIYQNPV